MRPAAQLLAELAQFDDPDPIPVFFLEKRHGAALKGLFGIHLLDGDLEVVPDAIVDQPLHGLYRLRRHLGKMRKIESQTVRTDIRTGLPDMIAQNRPKAACSKCVAVWFSAVAVR